MNVIGRTGRICRAGGRRYWRRRPGKVWGYQILKKEVAIDSQAQLETTVKMWQEIYDDDHQLVECHFKFPDDLGHQSV